MSHCLAVVILIPITDEQYWLIIIG